MSRNTAWGMQPDPADDWRKSAACRNYNPEFWFAPSNTLALAICARCPVKTQCLRFAVDNQIIDGVWGGLDEPQLRRQVGRRTDCGFGRGIVQARRQTCPQGHEYTPDNTIINPRNARVCRRCRNNSRNERRQRERVAA